MSNNKYSHNKNKASSRKKYLPRRNPIIDTLPRLSQALIFMLACVILFWRLDTPNLWVDELVTLQMIQGSFNDIMNACIRDIHPPLYFILLKGWTLLFGESDLWLRALSAIFASVSVIFMGMLGYRFFNERNQLLPMLLLSIHPAFIQFGRMARYYSLILMLGILCTILILNAIRTGRYRDWMFYTICSILLIYTFYPSGILLVAQAMVFVIPVWRKKAQKIWIISMVITAAAFLPWAVYVAVGQFSYTHSGIGSDLARSLIGLILGMGVSIYTFSVGETMFPWRPQAIVGLIIIMIHVVTGLFGARRSAGVRAAIISGLSMVFMSFVTTFMSVHTPFINTPVRALFALPYYLLILSAGWYGLRKHMIKKWLIALLLLIWGNGLINFFTQREFLNPIYFTPSKRAAHMVSENMKPDDMIISDLDSIFAHYFLSMAPGATHRFTTQKSDIIDGIKDIKPTRIWLVTIGRDQTRHTSPGPIIKEILAEKYRLSETQRLLPIDPTYRKIKNKILRRKTYEFRLIIERYDSVSS